MTDCCDEADEKGSSRNHTAAKSLQLNPYDKHSNLLIIGI